MGCLPVTLPCSFHCTLQTSKAVCLGFELCELHVTEQNTCTDAYVHIISPSISPYSVVLCNACCVLQTHSALYLTVCMLIVSTQSIRLCRYSHIRRFKQKPYLLGGKRQPECTNCQLEGVWPNVCQYLSNGPVCPEHDQKHFWRYLVSRAEAGAPGYQAMLTMTPCEILFLARF